jgi:hypothetical protein
LSAALVSLNGVVDTWSADQVLALAPDASSAAAGRKQAVPRAWSGTGASQEPAALWGLCQGSGKTPYQVVVDLSGPAFRCSCPSRKFPCKHAIGLLLLWSAGGVADGVPVAAFAEQWLASRNERAAKAATRPAADPDTTSQDGDRVGDERGVTGRLRDPAAAERRARERRVGVAAGLRDLESWLADQLRAGLAGLDRSAYGHLDRMAARMVDAQAPGIASTLRSLPAVLHSGDGWQGRLLAEYGRLHLLARAHDKLPDLPAPLAATVRARVGYPVSREEVLATPPERDRWTVLALRDRARDRLVERRVWLLGERTGRVAVVLSFAPTGRPVDSSLVPGTRVEADLHFYPGAVPTRALVGERYAEVEPSGEVHGMDVTEAAGRFGDAVAGDPWTTSLPTVLGDVRLVSVEGRWLLRDASGTAVPLLEGGRTWLLLAVSGTGAVTVCGDWRHEGMDVAGAVVGAEVATL